MNRTWHCLGGSSLVRKRNQPENHYINKEQPCTTTMKMNLLSSLVLSCPSSSVFSSLSVPVFFLCLCLSLSLSSFSVSVSVSVSISVSVCCCVLVCVVCVVWCVARLGTQKKPSVRRFKTSPCVPAPRAHVETHVRVVPVQTERFWTYTRWRFSSVKHVIFDISWAS